MPHKQLSIALLDMYGGAPNEGMRCIREIIDQYSTEEQVDIQINTYDVRIKKEIPDLTADIFISSGGPGSPMSEGEEWDRLYRNWLFALIDFNKNNLTKKSALFICHSFQLACRHFKIGKISKREHTSFGIFPVYKTTEANVLFNNLENPFHAFDNRDYQVISTVELPEESFILATEQTNITDTNAIMAIQFNEYMWGTQFHPEADAQGMFSYLQREERKQQVIQIHGMKKWEEMVQHVNNPMALNNTRNRTIPNFLKSALEVKYKHV